jgi:selenocysteine lyase/cysteine desulfurase
MEAVGKLFSAELLSDVRKHFLGLEEDEFSGKRLFLDSAAGALKLKTLPVLAARESAIAGQIISKHDFGSERIKEIIKRGEDDWRIFLNAKDGILYPDFAASGILWRIVTAAVEYYPGKNVVTTNLEHPCSYYSMKKAAEKYGKEFRIAKLNRHSGRVDVESILNLIDQDTSVLSVIHGSNANGAYNDIETICKEARKIKQDIVIIVDGVQYAPHGPIDIDAWKPDAYVFGPYKVSCIRGVGIAYINNRLSKIPHALFEGLPETQWLMGSKNHANYAAWTDTMDYLSWLGGHFTDSKDRKDLTVAAMTAIKENMLALANITVNGIDGIPGLNQIPHVRTYGAGEMKERTGLILFSIDGYDTDELFDLYSQQNIHLRVRHLDPFAIVPLQGMGIDHPVIRMSMAHYTSPAEVSKFLAITAEFAQRA